MQNRVQEFAFEAVLAKGRLKDVTPCACCLSRWVVDGSNQRDACVGLAAVHVALPVRDPVAGNSAMQQRHASQRISAIDGAARVLQVLRIAEEIANMLLEDLEALGAVSVAELTHADRMSLRVWPYLRPLQQRRLLQMQ